MDGGGCGIWFSIMYLQEGGRATADFTQGPAAAGGGAGAAVRRPGSANQTRDPVGTARGGVGLDYILPHVGGCVR